MITTAYPRGWGNLAMKNQHGDIHAAEDEKERKREIKRDKEGTGEQTNRSTIGLLLQDIREREGGVRKRQGMTTITETLMTMTMTETLMVTTRTQIIFTTMMRFKRQPRQSIGFLPARTAPLPAPTTHRLYPRQLLYGSRREAET